MPTYQYACTACGHQFEAVQSFSDPALTQCPECAGRLRKLYGAVGVVFKGSGFYRTDSRTGGGTGKENAPGGKTAEKSGGDAPGGTSAPAGGSGTSTAKATTNKATTTTKTASGAANS